MDGCTLDTEGEKQRVIKCLEAAIERRVSQVNKKSVVNGCVCLTYIVLFATDGD